MTATPSPSPGTDVSATAAQPGHPVVLDVGHCFVEPVRIAGVRWVTERTYVGYGGGLPRPRRFDEEGTFTVVTDDRALFESVRGARLWLEPAPQVLPARGCR